jgi:hypothetical protein
MAAFLASFLKVHHKSIQDEILTKRSLALSSFANDDRG